MKKVLVSIAAAALLCGAPAMAKTSAEVSAGAVKSAKSAAKERQVEVVKEAVDAVLLTQKVLVALEKNDVKGAKASLEKAIGKLEVVLAHPNAPALLPIDSSIVASEFTGDLKTIKSALKATRELLEDGKVQEARRLLDTLQSEIDIVTVSLPLISYPQALKLAAKYLNAGKTKEAKEVLEMALSTLVQSEVVIPLPLLKAEALIGAASKIAKTEKSQALRHLDEARRQLKIAEALGYTSESDTTYKVLDEAIASVEKEIRGKNRAEKLFEELMAKLKEFKEKAVRSIETKKSEQ
ncbi:YfdX family protein [Hydrogenimonas sp.]